MRAKRPIRKEGGQSGDPRPPGRARLVALSALLLAGFVLLGALAISTLREQRYDGVRINLAGRQRMLSQKLTKEVLLLAEARGDEGQVDLSVRVFDQTLRALLHGGRAPLDLALTQFRELPPMAAGPTRAQLLRVASVWSTFVDTLRLFLRSRDRTAFQQLVTLNLVLLDEMEQSVVLMQRSSERHSARIALVLGVTVVLVLALLAILLVSKVRQLRLATQQIQRLETLLPICASCKSIRREGADGRAPSDWVAIETYLKSQVKRELTHGLCPACVAKLYPEYADRE